jgi:PII-like signaling protein
VLEDHFYELSGRLPVVVEFIVSAEEAANLITFVQAEEATLFYVKMPVEFGWIKGPKN